MPRHCRLRQCPRAHPFPWPSPPRPRPLRPEEPPAADVLLPHPPSTKPDERHKQSSNARVNTMTLQAPDPCRGHVLQTAYSPVCPVIYAGERHLMSLYVILTTRQPFQPSPRLRRTAVAPPLAGC